MDAFEWEKQQTISLLLLEFIIVADWIENTIIWIRQQSKRILANHTVANEKEVAAVSKKRNQIKAVSEKDRTSQRRKEAETRKRHYNHGFESNPKK